jgi:hypothetical protein
LGYLTPNQRHRPFLVSPSRPPHRLRKLSSACIRTTCDLHPQPKRASAHADSAGNREPERPSVLLPETGHLASVRSRRLADFRWPWGVTDAFDFGLDSCRPAGRN